MQSGTKYKSIPEVVDGIRFASKKEARRYRELKILEKCGDIAHLETQPRFVIMIGKDKICTYVADFRYFNSKTQVTVIEDVKGIQTPVYKLKKKLVKALYDINIIEI